MGLAEAQIGSAALSLSRMQPSLSWMKPLGQERIGVHVVCLFEAHAVVAHELLQAPVIERIKRFGASADMLVPDEYLRDGRRLGAHLEHIADLAAPIVLLVIGRIEIDRSVRNSKLLEQLAHRPAELAPFQ